ncbi:MAG TPA: PAS domain-containing protein, partial [Methanocella sp.]|nr:PAS domain-containing protein [Methanocella sp.]
MACIGTFEWNIQTGVNKWTPELEAMYGLPRGGFTGTQEAWEMLVHPSDRHMAVNQVREAMGTGSFEGEWRVVWPDDTVHWLYGRGSVLKDESGKPLKLVGVNIDITERKKAELALQESESRFRGVFEQAPMGIAMIDSITVRFLQINPKYAEIIGRTQAEM